MKWGTANCAQCGQEFIKKTKNNIFCNHICLGNNANDKLQKKVISNRFAIFERDGFRCVYCGKSSIEENARLVTDHLIPQAKGGTNEHTNLVTCCFECNGAKNAQTLSAETIERIQKKITYRR